MRKKFRLAYPAGRQMPVKKGDMVEVIRGEESGKSGKVLQVIPVRAMALVEGVNFIKKHLRKSKDAPEGGIVNKEAPLAVAKLRLQQAHRARPAKAPAAQQ